MQVRRRKRKLLSLQLTSLLDMFTIILVFLLQSFQAEDENFTLHAGLELPTSDSRNPFSNAVNIAVSGDGVYVEGQRVHELAEGAATDKDLKAAQLDAIVQAVETAAAALEQEAGAEADGVVATIQADQNVPYDTIDMVMRSAAWAGCFRFRLVIAKG